MSKTPSPALKAPFPWFGGKSRVADLVWDRLGDVDNFVEPFAGGLAVLLRRPEAHRRRIETINDANHFVVNFWRAVAADPDTVGLHADGPVCEADLHARHHYLMTSVAACELRERMAHDPEAFDAKLAGWWVWGQCCWIGSGWCVERPNGHINETIPTLSQAEGAGVVGGSRKVPRLVGGAGVVVGSRPASTKRPRSPSGKTTHGAEGPEAPLFKPRKQLPRLTSHERSPGGEGVCDDRKAEHDSGVGHKLPRLSSHDRGTGGQGVNDDRRAEHEHPPTDGEPSITEARRERVRGWMRRLQDRLRKVRRCYGDWERVCTPATTARLGVTGVFLDPPYAHDTARMLAWAAHLRGEGPAPEAPGNATNRAGGLYSNDHTQDVDHLVARVHHWCRERGADADMRIIVAGYAGEHDALEALGWEVHAWKAAGGYGNQGGGENAKRERLWISPHCLRPRRAGLIVRRGYGKAQRP